MSNPHAETDLAGVLAAAQPGTRHHGELSIGELSSGMPIAIKYIVLRGRSAKPCLWINGQVHGVEINGAIAALDFANSINLDELQGSLVITATANPLAMDAREKGAPQDGSDLDQTYPGNASGFITDRLAHVLFKQVRACADVVINMHTNSPAFDGKPYSVYKKPPNDQVPEQLLLELMAHFEPSVACQMKLVSNNGELPGNIAGALDYQCLLVGIPAFMIELGGGSRAEADFIAQGVEGMRRCAVQLRVLPGKLPAAKRKLRLVTQRTHLTFDRGGFFRATVKAGESVARGTVLGSVMNMHGEVVETKVFDYDAIVICIRRDPVVHTGCRFIFIAKQWQEIEV